MISATLITWGSLTALTALVRTPMQLYLARFVLGAAEASFFPGVIVLTNDIGIAAMKLLVALARSSWINQWLKARERNV